MSDANANAGSAAGTAEGNAGTQGGNLLSSGTQDQKANAGANSSAWYLAEGVAGQGDKPEFFKDSKYKSIADQAKAYTELEKKFGGFTGAPEKYELKLPEELKEVQFDNEDPLFKDFEVFAKETNMSNDAYNKLLSVYARYEKLIEERAANEEKTHLVEEIKKLGGEKWAAEREQIKSWIQNRLPPELQEAAIEFGNSAANVQLLKYLMSQTQFPTVPGATGNNSQTNGTDLAKMMADKRYLMDPDYQKMVDEKYKALYSN